MQYLWHLVRELKLKADGCSMVQTLLPLTAIQATSIIVAPSEGLTDRTNSQGVAACRQLDLDHRSQLGQFLTPPRIARFMASLFNDSPATVRLLDAGAGVGMLTAAFVEEVGRRDSRPVSISAVAYELEPIFVDYLRATLADCEQTCQQYGMEFWGAVKPEDFVKEGADLTRADLFSSSAPRFNRAILNPPYKKIQSHSQHRLLLRSAGIEAGNLYAGFLAIAVNLLESGGELVAITPRSFCNGPYFKPFRKLFLERMTLKRIHVFETRDQAFSDDDILQENIIFHAVKDSAKDRVVVSTSYGPDDEQVLIRNVGYEQIIWPNDPDQFIHIPTHDLDALVVERMTAFQNTLVDLGLKVSTGRVVDFRARDALRSQPGLKTAPLIYPVHFDTSYVTWPSTDSKKPNAIALTPHTQPLMMPRGNYVLVKRFTSKEEPRRIVAAVFDQARIPQPVVGFENHLNVYHCDGAGLPLSLAKGLALFLNSTMVDAYFRQFSGHTQVNATDLRMLGYPDRQTLELLGATIGAAWPSQPDIDRQIEELS